MYSSQRKINHSCVRLFCGVPPPATLTHPVAAFPLIRYFLASALSPSAKPKVERFFQEYYGIAMPLFTIFPFPFEESETFANVKMIAKRLGFRTRGRSARSIACFSTLQTLAKCQVAHIKMWVSHGFAYGSRATHDVFTPPFKFKCVFAFLNFRPSARIQKVKTILTPNAECVFPIGKHF